MSAPVRAALTPNVAAIVAVIVIATLGCTKDAAPPLGSGTSSTGPGRPADATKGPVAARVLHLQGAARVDDGAGHVFPAIVALPLIASDVVDVQRDAFTLLALQNDRVVRVDEDLRLKVGEIVFARLPRTTTSIEDQVRALLPQEELRAVPVAELRERVAGWQARMAAANTAPVQAREKSDTSPSEAAMKAPAAEAALPEVAAAAPHDEAAGARGGALDRDAEAESGAGSGAGAGWGSDALHGKQAERSVQELDVVARKDAPPPGAQPAANAAPPPPAAPAAPVAPADDAARVASVARDAALGACLRAHFAELGLVDEPRVTVFVRTDAGRVVKVWLGGAIPTPACAKEAAAQAIVWPAAGTAMHQVVVALR